MPTKKDPAPGWNAIGRALSAIYDQGPSKEFKPQVPYAQGGVDPLDAVLAFYSSTTEPHWHYITFGFSDLYEKESEVDDLSGYGFELSFRLTASHGNGVPPEWPVALLNQLARAVYESGSTIHDKQHYVLARPIDMGGGARLNAVLIVKDNELPVLDTANGRVEFLQVVGLHVDESDALKCWKVDRLIDVFRAKESKNLVTNPRRQSLLEDPVLKAEVDSGAQKEQQSVSEIKCGLAEWIFTHKITIAFGREIIPQLKNSLISRLEDGTSLTISDGDSTVVFESGASPGLAIEDSVLVITLGIDEAKQFVASISENASRIHTLPNLPIDIEFVESPNRDAKSNMMETLL